MLEAVRRQGGTVQRVVLATSCAAYGDLRPSEAKREDHEVAPLSPYAAAKLTCEHYAAVYSRIYQVPTVALRYFNVFGPRQDPSSQYAAVVPNFVRAATATAARPPWAATAAIFPAPSSRRCSMP